MTTVTIGEAARQVGVEPHVLRHWDEVGVLRPGRTSSEHRRYSPDDIDAARVVRRLQRTGMSLADITLLLGADRAGREDVVAEHLARLRDTIRQTQRAIGFLEHTRQCRHRTASTCPECAAFARDAEPA